MYEGHETMGQLIDWIAESYDHRPAIHHDGGTMLYSELHEKVKKLAYGLFKLGIRKGDKIGIWMGNVPEWVIAWWAIPSIGGIVIPMDHWYKPSEAEYILHHSDSVGVVSWKTEGKWNFVNMLEQIKEGTPKLKHIILAGGDVDSDKQKSSRVKSIEEVMELGANWRDDKEFNDMVASVDADEVAFILYTSGTTGKPKGVMLTHYQIIRNAYDQGEILETTSSDNLVVPVPFSHCFGNVMSITLMTAFGGAISPIMAFDPKLALETITKTKATMIHGVPTMFIRELEELENGNYDVSHLRTGIMAGALCPVDTMRALMDKMNMNPCITYGLTEASPGVTMTRLDDSIEDKTQTVGRPLPGNEVKIVNDSGKEVPNGEPGELLCRGYNVMVGYYKNEEATKAVVDEDGWLHSGDLATMDDRSYVKIVGRKKEMIIVGGFNVYPKEIEEYIRGFDKIQDVAIVGVPDKDLGEVVGAGVVLKPGVKMDPVEVVDFCYGSISSAKCPRYVWITSELPVSGRGKVQKFRLVEKFKELIDSGELTKITPTAVKKK